MPTRACCLVHKGQFGAQGRSLAITHQQYLAVRVSGHGRWWMVRTLWCDVSEHAPRT